MAINSIYDVTNWVDDHTYNKHDPAIVSGSYARYATQSHVVTAGGVFSGQYW